jgi:hypothetical protein
MLLIETLDLDRETLTGTATRSDRRATSSKPISNANWRGWSPPDVSVDETDRTVVWGVIDDGRLGNSK